MIRMSNHSKERSKERVEGVETNHDARKFAKQAWQYGKHINYFQKHPKFFDYLKQKSMQSRSTHIRIFRDNIYIWRGSTKTLVTVHPIPDRFKEEMEGLNNE